MRRPRGRGSFERSRVERILRSNRGRAPPSLWLEAPRVAGRASRRLGVGEIARRRRLARFLRRGLEGKLLLRLSRRRLLSPREWELLLRLLGLRRRFRLRTLRGRGDLWAGPETRSGAEGA